MKKLVLGVLASLLALSLVGCNQNSDEPDYADDEVMDAVAEGIMERSDKVDAREALGTSMTTESLQEYTNTELYKLNPFREKQFEDTKLQEKILSYINLLEESLELTNTYPPDDFEFIDKWNALYDERDILLKSFVEDYGLRVEPEYQDVLDDLLLQGTLAEQKNETEEAINAMVSKIKFKGEKDDYFTTYTATVENTTGLDFEYFSLLVSLYDSDGVRIEDTYASASNWLSGEKVRFEFITDFSKVKSIKVTVDGYTLAEYS